jgi:hypothetical protein
MTAVIVLVAMAVGLTASQNKDLTCQSQVETFFAGIMDNKTEQAYDRLMKTSNIRENKEAYENLKEQTIKAMDVYGKPVGVEFIRQQDYGQSLIRLVYILKFKQAPLMWEFYYYKPAKEWKLVNIKFNDDVYLLAEK